MTTGARRNPTREAFWRQVIGGWEPSGLSVRAYCRRRGVSEPSFYVWRKALRRARGGGAAAGFVPVRVVGKIESGAVGGIIEIVLPRGRIVRVTPGFDAPALRAVIAALEGGGGEASC